MGWSRPVITFSSKAFSRLSAKLPAGMLTFNANAFFCTHLAIQANNAVCQSGQGTMILSLRNSSMADWR